MVRFCLFVVALNGLFAALMIPAPSALKDKSSVGMS